MREILFRAKRLDSGEWVEGYGVIVYTEYNEATIIHKQGNNITQHTAVDPETICQFTGLTDNNRNKIFEGDLVESVHYKKSKVYFQNGMYRIQNGVHLGGCSIKPTIIGNIFDNPEILQSEK